MTKLNGLNNAIMQVAYLLNGPTFNLLFCCNIVLYLEKVTSYEKFSENLTPEVEVVWKVLAFYCYICEFLNAEKYLNF